MTLVAESHTNVYLIPSSDCFDFADLLLLLRRLRCKREMPNQRLSKRKFRSEMIEKGASYDQDRSKWQFYT